MMTIAEFSLVAMMLTTFRVPLEDRPNLPRLADYLPPPGSMASMASEISNSEIRQSA
jgi:hypothetical protein